MAACAVSKEPRAASCAASRARVWERRQAGSDKAASAGQRLGLPGRRQAHRVTRTVPNRVASSLPWPVSSRLRVIPSAPAAGRRCSRAACSSRAARRSRWSCSSCRCTSRPRSASRSSSSHAVSPAASAACSSSTSVANKLTEAAKGPAPGIRAYGSIGLFFRLGFVPVRTFEPREKSPPSARLLPLPPCRCRRARAGRTVPARLPRPASPAPPAASASTAASLPSPCPC